MQRRRLAVVLLLGALAASVSIASFDVNAQPRRGAARVAKKPARKAPATKPNKGVAAPEEDDVEQQPVKAGAASTTAGQGPQVLDVKEQAMPAQDHKFGPVDVEVVEVAQIVVLPPPLARELRRARSAAFIHV